MRSQSLARLGAAFFPRALAGLGAGLGAELGDGVQSCPLAGAGAPRVPGCLELDERHLRWTGRLKVSRRYSQLPAVNFIA